MAGRTGSVRIIAGEWRGRRLRFPAADGLRPTSDRRRETLFNWLGADLTGLHCLDLFAGSGALGFEAASRCTSRVVMVESARVVVRSLTQSRDELGAEQVEIVGQPADRFLATAEPTPWDIVFLDPPFARPELARAAVTTLAAQPLAPRARIYIEIDAHRREELPIPTTWERHREMTAGDAHGLLYIATT